MIYKHKQLLFAFGMTVSISCMATAPQSTGSTKGSQATPSTTTTDSKQDQQKNEEKSPRWLNTAGSTLVKKKPDSV